MEFGCIGEHLGHSFSRIIHQRLGLYEYELQELAPEELDSFMRQADFRGINVTIPYKQAVIPYLDELSERARAIGAVNTIVRRQGRLLGDNTDFGGMLALFERMGLTAAGKKALILGSGGTSKTALAVLQSLGAGEVLRVSRHPQGHDISYADALSSHRDAQLIVNTTPCGMFPECSAQPIDISAFAQLEGVVDAIYNPLRSRLVQAAQKRGLRAEGGLYMLVAQAVLAAEVFMDQPVDHSQLDRIFSELWADKLNIVLIGMPGCGKTTVGKILAQELDRPLVDVDSLIVERAGRPISDIFAQEGEAAFRQLEADMIAQIGQTGGQIISPGGGAVLREDNVQALAQNGRLFFLDRPLADLTPTDDRPLSNDMDKLRRLFEERYPIYRRAADVTVPVTGPAEDVARRIIRSLT